MNNLNYSCAQVLNGTVIKQKKKASLKNFFYSCVQKSMLFKIMFFKLALTCLALKNIRHVYFRYSIRKLQNLNYFSEFSGNQIVESSCTNIYVKYVKLDLAELSL